jgi:hypothetical protein
MPGIHVNGSAQRLLDRLPSIEGASIEGAVLAQQGSMIVIVMSGVINRTAVRFRFRQL